MLWKSVAESYTNFCFSIILIKFELLQLQTLKIYTLNAFIESTSEGWQLDIIWSAFDKPVIHDDTISVVS